MATNLQRFTSRYGGRRFAACNCRTQTSLAENAARQWLLIAVSHVISYCVKRRMNEKEVLMRQRSAIFVIVAVT